MYLVVECSAISAPRFSGCCSAGEAKVLSTNSFTERSAATWATAAISAILSSGLVGVSSQISLVVGVIAARMASTSATGTGE
ncbi:Uncharacterised protein [Mycobacteroides abscessus subsp. abscessus]|nr:Uncharacterised protein [Mycobacteroides abscessus subsp. abscessus]